MVIIYHLAVLGGGGERGGGMVIIYHLAVPGWGGRGGGGGYGDNLSSSCTRGWGWGVW